MLLVQGMNGRRQKRESQLGKGVNYDFGLLGCYWVDPRAWRISWDDRKVARAGSQRILTVWEGRAGNEMLLLIHPVSHCLFLIKFRPLWRLACVDCRMPNDDSIICVSAWLPFEWASVTIFFLFFEECRLANTRFTPCAMQDDGISLLFICFESTFCSSWV